MEYENETARKIIVHGDGRTLPGRFDPEILDIVETCFDGFSGIYGKYRE